MRITINRMRGSLAHKVGSGRAVFRPDEILARHNPKGQADTSFRSLYGEFNVDSLMPRQPFQSCRQPFELFRHSFQLCHQLQGWGSQ